MSNYPYFCNYSRESSPNTFHRPYSVPPPPTPPPFFIPPNIPPPPMTDQEFIKTFEKDPHPNRSKIRPSLSINRVKEDMRHLVLTINNLKEKESKLKESINTLPEEEWDSVIAEIEKIKNEVNEAMSQINDNYLDSFKKVLSKRFSKRLRMKRAKENRRREEEQRLKELEEKSRKIDENLQKIKDAIEKEKQEEEATLEADAVLKWTLRKKHDTKKCIAKMDALLKLYKARQNTAKGRGVVLNDAAGVKFNTDIENLKALWVRKLQIYEQEECDLRATLTPAVEDNSGSKKEIEVLDNLAKWHQFLFGDNVNPQFDFQGDVDRFVGVRSQWDQYISEDGSSLPVGWVIPNLPEAP